MEKVEAKLSWAIFWVLVGTFVVIASVFLIPAVREVVMGFVFIVISGVVFLLLGVALIFLIAKEKVRALLRKFLILTGASAVGFFVSILLHNAIYGLFIHWFGTDFWDRIGLTDEPFFFLIAIVVCPVAFLVGTVDSMVLAIKGPK